MKSQFAASRVSVAKVLDHVATNITEAELEDDDFPALLVATDFDEDAIILISKMHNLFCGGQTLPWEA